MKFLRNNFLAVVIMILLLISLLRLNQLQQSYNQLSSQYFMLHSSVQNLTNDLNGLNSLRQVERTLQEVPAKEVMSPLELADYLKIPMDTVYDMTTADPTMPYVVVNGEYRFNKAAINKWMEKQRFFHKK